MVQLPVFAEGEPIYLPEAELSEAAQNSGAFNLSITGAEIDENSEAPYIFKVQRGGDYLPEATLRLDMIDITATYGKDYKLELYEDGGEDVQNSRDHKSIIGEMLDGLSASLESAYLPLNFAEGETEKTIAIKPKNNLKGDDDRTLTVNLVPETPEAIVGLSGANISIIDDEEQKEVTVEFSDTEYHPEDGSDAQLMADATASDVILGDKVDMKTFFNNMKVHLGGQVIKSGDEYTLTLPKMYFHNAFDGSPLSEISASTLEHYDYSGYQIEWTKESEAGNYSHTVTSAGTDVVSNEERWNRRKTNIFTNSISSSSFSVKLYYDEALLSTETKLTVHSVAPILRPFEVSLVPSDPLKFLNENGDYVDNTNIARLKNANDIILQNASTNGKGTAIKFSGDYITVTTNSPYSYISGLNIVDHDTGRSAPLLTGLKPGTTSASVQLTNDFITSNLYYINFADNNKNGKKGQIKIQAVLDYYDVDVNIHEDPNASVTMTTIRDPEEEEDDGSHIIRGDFYIKSASTGKYIYLDDPTFSYPKDVILKNGWGTKFTVTPSYLYPQGGQFDDLGVIKMSDWPNSALTLICFRLPNRMTALTRLSPVNTSH